MSYQKKQSTFITNTETKLLKERISSIVGFSKELKFLIGFFYYSEIRELYDAIRNNPNQRFNVPSSHPGQDASSHTLSPILAASGRPVYLVRVLSVP
jgi:hypothetical protein